MTTPDDEYEPLRRSPVTGPQPQAGPPGSTTNGSGPAAGETSGGDTAAYDSGAPAGYGPPAREQQPYGYGPPGFGPSAAPGPWQSPMPVPGPTEPVPTPMPIPTIRTVAGGRDSTVRIGLWGGPHSGKTTVLSALPIAAIQGAGRSSGWIVTGVNDSSTSVLTEGVNMLINSRRFPNPTDPNSRDTIMWSFQGHDAVDPREPQRWSARLRRPSGPQPIEFALQLQDFSGENFRYDMVSPQIVESLALSNGLLFLFDPVFEGHTNLQSFNYFYGALQQVAARVRNENRMDRGRLPHHVSVLVTKFDDPGFFSAAVNAGWVHQEQAGARMPYVPLEHGPAFFDWVSTARHGGTASLVRDALRSFFHVDRIEYFASSAIGFRLNPHGVFDYGDYANVEIRDGQPGIKSLARPMNVLEPLIRLERRIRRSRGPA